MKFLRKLPTADEIKEQYPLTEKMKQVKAERDAEIRDVFTGASQKLILIIGPCSADNKDAVMDYIGRLREVQEKVKDHILMIPRIYTNKPRTNGDGYKGMLHQPNPTEKPDMLKGIIDRHGLNPDEIAMVGDRIYTDTAMAHNAGAFGVLVLSGETTLETAEKVAMDAENNPDPEFYPPDRIVRDIEELVELLVSSHKQK